MRKRCLTRLLVLATLAVLAGAAATAQTVVWADAGLAVYPGTAAAIVVTLDVLEGWYILDRAPPLPQLIPTQVVVHGPPGISVGEVQYPEPMRKWFSFARRELGVYTGEVEFIVPFVVAPDAEPGVRTIRAVLTYQPCSDRVCRPPEEEELLVSVRILPPTAVSSRANSSARTLVGAALLALSALGVLGVRWRFGR